MTASPAPGLSTPFLWGVATSPYQSEGGYNGPGQPQTNWARAEREGRVTPVGKAAEFWSRYRQDFEVCSAIGLSAFRLGIEWSRVQPTLKDAPGNPPDFDYAALDHYASMLRACRQAGMEPVLTLHHFVHPAWLGLNAWLSPETAGHFVRYVGEALAHVNLKLVGWGQAPVRYYLTINEPNMLVLNTYLGSQFPSAAGFGSGSLARALGNLLCAHIRAYRSIHALYRKQGWVSPLVSLNNYCSDLYWLDKLVLDLLAARERGIAPGQARAYILDRCRAFESALRVSGLPYVRDLSFHVGSVFKLACRYLGRVAFHACDFDAVWEALYEGPDDAVLDFVALDYYDPFTAHAFRPPTLQDHDAGDWPFLKRVAGSLTSKWWDWRVLPGGMNFFCSLYACDFARPVLIAENGMALHRRPDNVSLRRRDRLTRSEFLQLNVEEVAHMRLSGTPLLGYLHWSLFDNYEWGTFTPRFGLFSLDYSRGAARIGYDHQGDCPSATYRRLIRFAAGQSL